MSITTHVLDTALGLPGHGINTRLEILVSEQNGINKEEWSLIAEGITNEDGRIPNFLPTDFDIVEGVYRITFLTSDYFKMAKRECFYPYASIVFNIQDPKSHYHVPLLISGFGFSTYRGS